MTLILVAALEAAAILAFFTVKAIERILERRQRAEWEATIKAEQAEHLRRYYA